MILLHPLAWIGWLSAALVALSATRNPLHLLLTLLCIAIVNISVGFNDEFSTSPVSPVRFALLVVPLTALFNAATVHVGDTVLFRLPGELPILSGPVTLEAAVYGAINGLVLSGILAAFATLGRALPTRALIWLIPRAFYPLAVVASIAVTLVPTTLRQFQQIREAQAVRGHKVRGLRDGLPLFMPLLVGGLERALRLAEAMTARGFASASEPRRNLAARTVIVMGLIALLCGWLLRLVWGGKVLGLGMMLGGGGGIIGALWFVGRQVPRTTYRPQPWRWMDSAVVLSAAVALAIFVVPGLDRTALYYYPYPALSPPRFDPMVGVATLGLVIPAFLLQNTPS